LDIFFLPKPGARKKCFHIKSFTYLPQKQWHSSKLMESFSLLCNSFKLISNAFTATRDSMTYIFNTVHQQIHVIHLSTILALLHDKFHNN